MQTDKNKEAASFFQEQLRGWQLAAENYQALNSIEEKRIQVGDFQVIVQYNPNRIQSSAAKIDQKSIRERPCFLCSKNRPQEQSTFELNEQFDLLVNPYPIFNPHFTVAHKNHIPQQIVPFLDHLLQFSNQFSDYTFFYNGPTCGASAPDHLHFQACYKNSMPIENFWKQMAEKFHPFNENKIYKVANNTHSLYVIVSKSKDEVIRIFEKTNAYIAENKRNNVDYNLLASFHEEEYLLYIFPRKQHRPVQYYETGEKQLLISPGAVDMGGIIIISRKEDFEKITSKDVTDIYQQVSLFL